MDSEYLRDKMEYEEDSEEDNIHSDMDLENYGCIYSMC